MALTTIKLTDWVFRCSEEEEWLPAAVPGCVHTDLLRNGKIPDPFYRMNETELQWIDKKDWEYTCTFDVPGELLDYDGLELLFEGLDTYGDIRLNGKPILSVNNMFRQWRVNVKDNLVALGNVLTITFRSPVKEDLPKLEQLGYALPAPNDQSELGGLGDRKISVFARKAPYHYGWDWGPRFVTSGIWKEVRLEGWMESRIQDVYIQQKDIEVSLARLTAQVELDSSAEQDGVVRITSGSLVWEKEVKLVPGAQTVAIDFEIENPELWWCRGFGEPRMYTFQAELHTELGCSSRKSVRTGLRSVKLKREKDGYGESFYIELNGVPVFCKGANHIPNDSFVTEVSEERYRHEIVTAVESNMNMLRVWGGGIYEYDIFYDLCDEYGLLVWQDFMFACSMYPGDPEFLENVKHEAADTVKRLRNHPSLVLWCGNNEIDSAWAHYKENAGWGWKQQYNQEQREKLWADYEAIFHTILPDAVFKYAPGAEYWPSSPLVSLSKDEHQHTDPSSTSGDVHYWGVWHNREPFDNYNRYVGRFMSEYGFQSFPELQTVLQYAEESDLDLESDVMTAHQKNGAGNQIIKQYMELYMKEPKDFPSFLYMSQILQADAMKAAIHAHRRNKPYCMGSLYWQMNDCWPVASWAGMDYYGRWKALQYEVKRSFSPLLLSIDASVGGHLSVYVVSDLSKPVIGKVLIELVRFNGVVCTTRSFPVYVHGHTVSCLYSEAASLLLGSEDPSKVVLSVKLVDEHDVIGYSEHYFAPTKELVLEAPDIHMTVLNHGVIELTSNRLAKQVYLSAEAEGIFTDNYFDLIPGTPRKVSFLSRHEGSGAYSVCEPGKVMVRSMADFI